MEDHGRALEAKCFDWIISKEVIISKDKSENGSPDANAYLCNF